MFVGALSLIDPATGVPETLLDAIAQFCQKSSNFIVRNDCATGVKSAADRGRVLHVMQVCCSVMYVCCSVMQMCCSVLQVCCSVMQVVAK